MKLRNSYLSLSAVSRIKIDTWISVFSYSLFTQRVRLLL